MMENGRLKANCYRPVGTKFISGGGGGGGGGAANETS